MERALGLQPHSLSDQPQPEHTPPSSPAGYFLSYVSSKPLTWLWPGRIPLSHLTLLDAAPALASPSSCAILRFLHDSASPHNTQEILEAACYDYTAGRKLLFRMKIAGELVSPARGLYTTPNHPCLVQPTDETPPVPTVPTVPITNHTTSTIPTDPPVPGVPNPVYSTANPHNTREASS